VVAGRLAKRQGRQHIGTVGSPGVVRGDPGTTSQINRQLSTGESSTVTIANRHHDEEKSE